MNNLSCHEKSLQLKGHQLTSPVKRPRLAFGQASSTAGVHEIGKGIFLGWSNANKGNLLLCDLVDKFRYSPESRRISEQEVDSICRDTHFFGHRQKRWEELRVDEKMGYFGKFQPMPEFKWRRIRRYERKWGSNDEA
jgi:hypothetical protein